MQTATLSNIKAKCREKPPSYFVPLELVNKPNVDTAHAAHVLGRQPQTLRGWACLENGPLRPIRVHGRLAWPVAELRRLLAGGAK